MRYFYLLSKFGLFLSLIILVGCKPDEMMTKEEIAIWVETDSQDITTSWTSMSLTQVAGQDTMLIEGKIKRRGGYSISFPKHSYEIDLLEDYSLGCLPSDDDWILNANCIDKTFLRHTVSYQLFRVMDSSHLSAQFVYLSLSVNGVPSGLYVLMEKLDKSSLEIEDDGVIFKEPHIFRKSYDGVVPQYADNYHQQTFPDIADNDLNNSLDSLHAEFISLSDSAFTQLIISTFDLRSLIDWHLLLLISNNNDGVLKNFYLYRQSSRSKYRIAPWDYDHSYGRDGDNELNLINKEVDIHRSLLFDRLLDQDWYRDELKSRWSNHTASGVLSLAGLKSKFKRYSDQIDKMREENFEVWSLSHSIYQDANTPSQEMDIIYQYLEMRHQSLEEYFEGL